MQKSSNFTIYSASAGSGKTFKLAERYLTLLLSSPKNTAFQNILAITFTNKAVGEMKSRILEYLTFFSKGQDLEQYTMFQYIQANTNLSLDQIQKKSYFLLKEILDNYAAFEVSTIDAFTHRIIRTFAKDLGLSMNFNIEMDTKQVLQLAVERVIEKAGNEKKLTKVLVDFALEKVNEDKSGNISLDIFEASSLLLNEKDEAYINFLRDYELEDFTRLKNQLGKEIDSITDELVAIGSDFLEELEHKGVQFEDFKGHYLPKFFQKLKENNTALKFDSKWQLSIEDEETYVKKNQDEETKQLVFSMRDFIVEKFKRSESLFSDRKFYEKIYRNITQLSLLGAVSNEMELIKKEENIMLISDFNKKISEEIKKQPAPFIFERLGEKFQHYFIDEFQDTSRMQWENLIPLTGNALASMYEGGTPGTITLVGDAKQSIYAWRGGDAHQFIALSEGNSPFPSGPKLETLSTNFRSSKAIVNFNNQFFEHVGNQLKEDQLKTLFSGERLLQATSKSAEGFVNIKFVEAKTNEERHDIYPEEVLNVILSKKEQGFHLGDICVLVRKKSEGIAIAEFLNQHQIPIISSETLLINSDEQVRLILNLLNVLNDELDEISKAEVLEIISAKLGYADDKQFTLLSETLNKNKEAFWETLNALGYFIDRVHFHSLPFYDAVEYLIHTLQLEKEANAYLQFFLDEVFEFTIKKKGNINSFLDYWKLQGESKSIISTENENAVQIMTVHKSKGLQFPILIFPYAKQEIDYTLNSHIWVNLPEKFKLPFAIITKPGKEINHPLYNQNYSELISSLEMENINILYVALTRAVKELHIISEDDRSKSGAIKLNTFSGLFMSFIQNTKNTEIEVNVDYNWGETSPSKQEEIINEEVKNKKLIFHNPSSSLNLNLVTTAGKLWNREHKEALDKGNLIHSLLSNIKSVSDKESSIARHVEEGYISTEEIAYYEGLINSVLSHPELSEYFKDAQEVWNERDIFYQKKLLRPDRVNFKGNDAYIIDYKTGAFAKQHEFQIKEYAQALRSLKYNVKKMLLVYISDSIDVKIV